MEVGHWTIRYLLHGEPEIESFKSELEARTAFEIYASLGANLEKVELLSPSGEVKAVWTAH